MMSLFLFGLLAVSLSCIVIGSCVNNKIAKTVVKNTSDTLFYNLLLHGTGIVVMFLYARSFSAHASTILRAIIFGTDSILCFIMTVLALKNGPMALSALIGTAGSLLVSVILGVILFHETVAPIQAVGIALILISMVPLTGAKAEGKLSPTWFFFIGGQTLFGGFQGIIQKWQGDSPYPDEKPAFLLYTFLTCTVLVAIWLLVRSYTGKREKVTAPVRKILPAALLTGLTESIVHILSLRLAIEVPAAVYFPINSGGYILLATAASALIFKEKLTKSQKVAFAIGFVAIFLVADVF